MEQTLTMQKANKTTKNNDSELLENYPSYLRKVMNKRIILEMLLKNPEFDGSKPANILDLIDNLDLKQIYDGHLQDLKLMAKNMDTSVEFNLVNKRRILTIELENIEYDELIANVTRLDDFCESLEKKGDPKDAKQIKDLRYISVHSRFSQSALNFVRR